MKTKNLLILILIAAFLSNTFAFVGNNIGGIINNTKAEVINRGQLEKNVYIDMGNMDSRNSEINMNMVQLQKDILENNKKYIIDFSHIKSDKERGDAKKAFYKGNIASFDANLIIISRYKNKLIYSEFSSSTDLNSVLDSLDKLSMVEDKAAKNKVENSVMPHISFYINVVEKIKPEDCTFPVNFDNMGQRLKEPLMNLCSQPNIALIYRVSYARSLPFNGSGTPDAKILRITVDDDSRGNGVVINYNGMKNVQSRAILGGYHTVKTIYTSSAIANNYAFDIKASNTLVTILVTKPENLNSNYSSTHSSKNKYGINPKLSVFSPNFSMSATAEFTDTRSLTFNTQDYKVIKTSPNPQIVSFKWQRQEHATADSLIIHRSSTVFWDDWNVDLNRVKPISYANFTPSFDVIYMANPGTKGETTFNINGSVSIRPLYTLTTDRVVYHQYSGFEGENVWKNVKFPRQFKINWDHPVFLGGWPVNLQLQDHNGCISINDNKEIQTAKCDLLATNQSFMYDKQNRFRSVEDITMCLDGKDLTMLYKCDSKLTQEWRWKEERLINQYKLKVLTYDKQTGSLTLNDFVKNLGVTQSTRLGTRFTEIIQR